MNATRDQAIGDPLDGDGMAVRDANVAGPSSSSKRQSRRGGLRLPPDPPETADALDVALYYVKYFEAEFFRARGVVKHRATVVVVVTATLSGVIATLGALIAILDAPWLGVVSTALASTVAILTAWDKHYNHSALWAQRTQILAELQELRRRVETERRALGTGDADALAKQSIAALDRILLQDRDTWASISRDDHRPERAAATPAAG